MNVMIGTVISITVGSVVDFEYRGESATSAIWKQCVSGRVAARGVNLEGDDQADRTVHGGADQAVYAYAAEDINWWRNRLEQPIEFGHFGENLTTEGIDVSGAIIGERWKIGSATFEVSSPRFPCWKLGHRMGDPTFPKQFTQAARPGAYLRITNEGEIGIGDTIRVLDRPEHGLSIVDFFHIYTRDRDQRRRLLSIPNLADTWRQWAKG